MFGSEGYITQVILENCDECIDEKNEILKQKRDEKMEAKIEQVKTNYAGWFWLIEKVKDGPISDIICLIPKICHAKLFGNIFMANHVTEFQQDYFNIFKLMVKYDAPLGSIGWGKYDFLKKAIQAKNVEMVKFVAPKIKVSQYLKYLTGTEKRMVEKLCKMSKESGNREILDFLNFWTDRLRLQRF